VNDEAGKAVAVDRIHKYSAHMVEVLVAANVPAFLEMNDNNSSNKTGNRRTL